VRLGYPNWGFVITQGNLKDKQADMWGYMVWQKQKT